VDQIDIAYATRASEYEEARALFLEYANWLAVDLCFQGFAAELDRLREMYGPPAGCLILGRAAEVAVACVGVRRLSADACEMKRLFVRADARGSGLGRRLAVEAVAAARRLGYRRMLLDTLETMDAAQHVYASLGFRATAAYYDNPLPGVRYYALDLRAVPAGA
jgi:GNAT superfamily N-acetyltransferase